MVAKVIGLIISGLVTLLHKVINGPPFKKLYSQSQAGSVRYKLSSFGEWVVIFTCQYFSFVISVVHCLMSTVGLYENDIESYSGIIPIRISTVFRYF